MKRLILFSTLLVFVDQVTKYLMQGKTYFENNFVALIYTTNTGAAFGILKGWNLFFIIVTIAVIAGIFYYHKIYNTFGLTLLLAGSVGNLIDRIFLGHVRDFIYVKYFSTFNLADAYNVIGVMLILLYMKKLK
ncbi:signal peptidase II [Candidatus Woesearchaeota archaeon]|nr:MAG: signal peptidase II [Candidatus Woesearchaeota archaeon]